MVLQCAKGWAIPMPVLDIWFGADYFLQRLTETRLQRQHECLANFPKGDALGSFR